MLGFRTLFVVGILIAGTNLAVLGQQKNKTMDNVPDYTLPDSLVCSDGTRVGDSEAWAKKRRPEVLSLFADHVYGNYPGKKVPVQFHVAKEWSVFDNTAVAREVEIRIGEGSQSLTAQLLLFVPRSDRPVPCFLGLNFNGNHTVHADPKISMTTSWVRNNKQSKASENRASEKDRGTAASRWPVEAILKRGYALATIYYGDIDPDFDDEFQNGIHPLFYKPNQTSPAKQDWGSIGAWAWGLSRAMDYLETEPAINASCVAVMGHSRLGKTSLWAGASDSRFGVVISNDSGCGGAAVSRRQFGETVKRINTVFPHWFCDQFAEYNDQEDKLPVDQHMLVALMAPRAVYVASATGDQWADPKGEYESLAGASSVYELYGNPVVASEQPEPDKPVQFGKLGYHLRTGNHDITLYDWQRYFDFADSHFDPANEKE